MIVRKAENLRDSIIVESSHRDRTEVESGDLQQNVLCDVTGLDVHLSHGAITVFGCRTTEDRRHHEDGGCILHGLLADGVVEQ